jgi:hypothetical protein
MQMSAIDFIVFNKYFYIFSAGLSLEHFENTISRLASRVKLLVTKHIDHQVSRPTPCLYVLLYAYLQSIILKCKIPAVAGFEPHDRLF